MKCVVVVEPESRALESGVGSGSTLMSEHRITGGLKYSLQKQEGLLQTGGTPLPNSHRQFHWSAGEINAKSPILFRDSSSIERAILGNRDVWDGRLETQRKTVCTGTAHSIQVYTPYGVSCGVKFWAGALKYVFFISAGPAGSGRVCSTAGEAVREHGPCAAIECCVGTPEPHIPGPALCECQPHGGALLELPQRPSLRPRGRGPGGCE